MNLLRRTPESGEPALIAEVERSRSELLRVEAEAAAAVGNARGALTATQSRLDEWRRSLVANHANQWRRRAEDLRRQAEDVGDLETVIDAVIVLGGMGGGEVEPRLRFKRAVVLEEAAVADVRAQQLEDRLAVGDLAGESLELLCSQLEPLPAEAETVAA